MKAKKRRVAGQALFIEGWWVGCLLIDWVGWEAAHLLIGLGGRQGLWKKEVKMKKFQLMHAKSLAWPATSCHDKWTSKVHMLLYASRPRLSVGMVG